jgi:hypothetical protein
LSLRRTSKGDRANNLPARRPQHGVRLEVFSGKDPGGIFSREIRDVKLTGKVRYCATSRECNVVDSLFEGFGGESVDFTRCDFKDSVIRNSEFLRCRFGMASFAATSFLQTGLKECQFPDTSIQDCDFTDVEFVRCDLRNIVVKTCTFIRCTFVDCVTNNKVFETSRFSECQFTKTELQVETIEENFGLTAAAYDDGVGSLRKGRDDGERPVRRCRSTDLRRFLKRSGHPLKALNLEYFITGSLLEGSVLLDAAFDLRSWLSRRAGSFIVTLRQWSAFLVWLYDRNELPTHTVIHLYSMVSVLIRHLEGIAPDLTEIFGIHRWLAEQITPYTDLLDSLAAQRGGRVRLLVEGSGNPAFYGRELGPLLERGRAEIVSVRPHNSPWDLTAAIASGAQHYWFFALLLASRLKIELYQLKQRARKSLPSGTTPAKRSGTARRKNAPKRDLSLAKLLDIHVGIGRSDSPPALDIMLLLPHNLVAELKLDVASRQVAAIRRIVKDIL